MSAFVAISVFGELTDRRFVVPCVLSALGALALTWVFHDWIADPSWSELFFFTIISLGLAAALGAAFGGTQRRAAVSASLLTSFLTGCFIVLDRILSAWTPGRTIATVGPNTPNFEGTFWARMVDYAGHQVLPTIALALIGFATYSRFTRASMLDTMKSDYVRTARAKGLRPAQVIFRHAFRTALIPVVTVITLGFAAIIEGAVITENVFGWSGMGTLFVKGLQDVDPYPVMGFVVVVVIAIVLVNMIADILYGFMDPRIRVV